MFQWYKDKFKDDRGSRYVVTHSGGGLSGRKDRQASLHVFARNIKPLVESPWFWACRIALFALCIGLGIKELYAREYSYALNPCVGAVLVLLSVPAVRRFVRFLRTRADATDPYCLACGYDLRGTTVADDGCRVCSECSAAWKFACDAETAQPTHANAAHPQQEA